MMSPEASTISMLQISHATAFNTLPDRKSKLEIFAVTA